MLSEQDATQTKQPYYNVCTAGYINLNSVIVISVLAGIKSKEWFFRF